MPKVPIPARQNALNKERRWILSVLITFLLLAAIICALLFPRGECSAYRTLKTGSTQSRALQTLSDRATPEPAGYHTLPQTESDIHRGNLILINAQNRISGLPDESDLVKVFDGKTESYNVSDETVSVSAQVLPSLNRMLDDFYAAYQTDAVLVASGYRSYTLQTSLLEDETLQKGETEAARWITQPGYSEHHTGLAVDLSIYHTQTGLSENYNGDGIYAWINQNAYRYGFVVRYEAEKQPVTGIAAEPWHFRYVGLPHAYIMQENDFCLEEYLAFLQEYPFDRQHLHVKYDGTAYTIYYTNQLDVPVPSDRDYVISGNNTDGFIVTITEKT